MKIALVLFLVSLSASAAERRVPYVRSGEACAIEGERVYMNNGEDHEVFECKNGAWEFLFTRMPNEDK